MDVCPAFCVGVPLPYFRFKPVIIVREKKRTVSQANFYVLSSWASFIKQSFSLVYYDKLTLVKSKKEPVFWEGSVPRGGTL